MALSDFAIGFYLEVEDQMTPVLAQAEKGYNAFMKGIEAANQKAYEAGSKGLHQMGQLAKSMTALPKDAGKAYAQTINKIAGSLKNIEQPISLKFTTKTKNELTKVVGAAVVKALGGVKIRLSAAMPLTKSKLFDTSVVLRSLYRDIPQPPDMKGGFQNLPKFAEGGVVGGPKFPADSIVARLTGGEEVLPEELRKTLNDLMDTVGESINASKALQAVAAAGLDPQAGTKASKALKMANKELITTRKLAKELSKAGVLSSKDMDAVARSINDITGEVDDMNKEVKESGKVYKNLLTRILTTQQLDALQTSIQNIQEAWGNLSSNASSAFGELDRGELEGALETTRDMANAWGMNNAELSTFRADLRELDPDSLFGGAEMAKSAEGLMEFVDNADDALKLVRAQTSLTLANLDGMGESVANLGSRFDQSQVEQFAAQMVALNQQTNLGSGFIESFGSNLTRALENDPAAITALMNMGVGPDALDTFRQTGDATDAIEGALLRISEIGQGGSSGAMLESLGIDVTARQAEQLGGSLDRVLPALSDMQDGTSSLEDVTRTADTAFASLGRKVSNFVSDNFSGLIEAFEQFNPVALIAIAQVAQLGISMLTTLVPAVAKGSVAVVGMIAKMFGWGAASSAAAAGNATVAASTAAAGASVGGFGATLTAVGAGLKAFVLGIGSTLGGAFSALMTGIATGLTALAPALTALTPAIPVILVLSVAMVALGAALWLATPAIEAIAGAFVGLAQVLGDVVLGTIEALASMDITQMLMFGPALMATAVGFLALAPAVIAFGAAMGIAAVGVGAFMLVGGLGGGSGSISESVEGIIDSMSIPPTKLKRGVVMMRNIADFVGNFAKAALILTGMAIVAKIGDIVNGVLSLFGAKSPFETLVDQGRDMRNTIHSLVAHMTDLPGESQLQAVNVAMAGVVRFLGGYATMSEIMNNLPGTGVFSRITEGLLSIFGVDSPMEALTKQGTQIASTIRTIATQFSGVAAMSEQIAAASTGLANSAVMLRGLRPMINQIDNLGDLAGKLEGGMFSDGSLKNLNDHLPQILRAVRRIVRGASSLNETQATWTDALFQHRQASVEQKPATPILTPEQIDSLVTVMIEAERDGVLHGDMQENNRLLNEVVRLMKQGGGIAAQAAPAQSPARANARGRGARDFTRNVANGDV